MERRYYGRYERGEWLPEWHRCTCCGNETLEFLVTDELEVIGCTECTVTSASYDEKYMIDIEDSTYLLCPCCGKTCETLYSYKKQAHLVDGCDNCLHWVDAYKEEE